MEVSAALGWLRLHHGYIGIVLILGCVIAYLGEVVVEELNFGVWMMNLVFGIILTVHDLRCHLTHKK